MDAEWSKLVSLLARWMVHMGGMDGWTGFVWHRSSDKALQQIPEHSWLDHNCGLKEFTSFFHKWFKKITWPLLFRFCNLLLLFELRVPPQCPHLRVLPFLFLVFLIALITINAKLWPFKNTRSSRTVLSFEILSKSLKQETTSLNLEAWNKSGYLTDLRSLTWGFIMLFCSHPPEDRHNIFLTVVSERLLSVLHFNCFLTETEYIFLTFQKDGLIQLQ